jgi:hypothetical protein
MSTKKSITGPGLVQHAKAAQREVVRLQALLSLTTEAHVQATTDAGTAKTALDALIITIAALLA